MERPRFLLIGKNGQVGWELRRTLAPLGELVTTDYPEIELANPDSLRRWVRDTQPQVIVNAAAYTAVDKSESEPELCHAVNATAPGIMAEEACRLGALLVHYSTDYVFDGTKGLPYREEDTVNPLGVYGRTKLAGDLAVQSSGARHLIFRLCWVYGSRGQNFMLTIRRLARERETLRVVADQIGCPTWSRLIAETTALALQQVLAASDPNALLGLYHLAAAGNTSWHGFASRIVELMPQAERKCREVQAIPTSEYPTPTLRPLYTALDCEKLERVFALKLPHWSDCLDLVHDSGS